MSERTRAMSPRDTIYEKATAMGNKNVPLEDWPAQLIEALARAGYAVVPVALPEAVLGEAAISGVFETGNPKHGWDYLLGQVRAF